MIYPSQSSAACHASHSPNFSPRSQRLIRSLREGSGRPANNADELIADRDQQIGAIIDSQKAWPPRMNRVKKFNMEELTQVRMYSSEAYTHERVLGKRKNCPLCALDNVTKRGSKFTCSVCKVPLCVKPHDGQMVSCFTLWHSTQNLEQARAQQRQALQGQRIANKDNPSYAHARSAASRLARRGTGPGLREDEFDEWEEDAGDMEEAAAGGGGHMRIQDKAQAEGGGDGDDKKLVILSSSSSSESEDSTTKRWNKYQEEIGKLTLKQRIRKMRRELDEYLAPKPDECAPGEELSEESFLAMVGEIETAVTSSAMGYKSWGMLKEQLGACRVERGHANYDRWKMAARAVIRRKVENDMVEESGEEEESKCESSEQAGKTSGLGPEDYAEQGDEGATPYLV